MAFVPIALAAVGTAVSIAGSLQQAEAAKQAHQFNAQQAAYQARIAREQAAIASENHRKSAVRKLGSIRAGYAAAGVATEGSPLEVLSESATNAERDRILIEKEGEARARGYMSDRSLSLSSAAHATNAGYLSAAGHLVQGASSIYDKW